MKHLIKPLLGLLIIIAAQYIYSSAPNIKTIAEVGALKALGSIVLKQESEPAIMHVDAKHKAENVFEALRKHQVSPELQAKLDKLFANPEIRSHFSALYCSRNAYPQSTTVNSLKENGFTFHQFTDYSCGGWNQDIRVAVTITKFNVFFHKDFPEFVFKLGFKDPDYARNSEQANAQRILTALIDRNHINSKNIKGKNDFTIEIPSKKAYFFPQSNQMSLPKVLVVAEKVEKDNPNSVSPYDILGDRSGFLSEVNNSSNLVINQAKKKLYIVDTGSQM